MRHGIARFAAALLLAATAAGGAVRQDEPPEMVFDETIHVGLVTFTARVVDASGTPLRGLGVGDFSVRIGGVEVPLAAVDWIEPQAPASAEPAAPEPAAPSPQVAPADVPAAAAASDAPDRLVLVFVQADLRAPRARGHLRTLPAARDFLADLPASDQVAVVSFDSQLRLRQDATHDRDAAADAIWAGIHFGEYGERPPDRGPLARALDREEARRAASPEAALRLAAEALAELPGEKLVVYLGWGLGRYGSDGVRMTPDYGPAVRALFRARAPVFVLDVTAADYHSLEVGLRTVAEETGGTYDKTNIFTRQATSRLTRVLAGHYLLSIDPETIPPAGGSLRVTVRRPGARVLARRSTIFPRGPR